MTNKTLKELLDEIDESLNQEGTLDFIMLNALKEIDDIDKLKIDEYELKAYTLNVINQTKSFIKSFIKGDEIKWMKKNC